MGEPRDLSRIVADKQHNAFGQQLKLDELLSQCGGSGVKGGGWFVKKEHPWLIGQGSQKTKALPLSGREFDNWPVQVDRTQGQGGKKPVKLGCQREMLAGRRSPPSRFGRGVAHMAAPFGTSHLAALNTVEMHVTAGRVEIGYCSQQPCLAGSRGTLHSQTLTRRDLERERG